MIEQWLRWDGPVMDAMERIAQIIILSGLWLVGCLPVVTLLTSSAALYEAVANCLRRGQGSSWRTFLQGYRKNLGRGILATLTMLPLGGLLVLNVRILAAGEGRQILLGMNLAALALLIMITVYTAPVLSRFPGKLRRIWQMSFVLCLRFWADSLWMGLGTVLGIVLQIYVLPAGTALLLPGAWCLLISMRMERHLGQLHPPENETKNSCHDE